MRNSQFFDTLKIQPSLPVEDIKARAEAQEINLRYFPDGDVIDSLIEIYQEDGQPVPQPGILLAA